MNEQTISMAVYASVFIMCQCRNIYNSMIKNQMHKTSTQ